MSDTFEHKLLRIPVISTLVKLTKRIPVFGFSGLSLYDILELYSIGIIKGAFTSRAGGIAFSFLTAVFPFLIFILTVIKYIPIDGFQEDFFYLMDQWLPPTTSKVAHDQVINYINNHNYGGMVSFYFLLSVVFMSNGVSAIFEGFQNSYHVNEYRSLAKFYWVSFFVSLLLAFYLLTTVAVNFYFEVILEKLMETGLVGNSMYWIKLSQKIFFIAMVFISISTLFYFGTKESKFFKFVSPGSILTTLLILIMTYYFGIYVVKYSKYNELYGSIGTLLIFMLFIWLNSILLLLGFELNASLHQIKKSKNLNFKK
jgi:membrane protein